MQITVKKQNEKFIFISDEDKYEFQNKDEFHFFCLQTLKDVEDRRQFLSIVACLTSSYICKDVIGFDVSDLFLRYPDSLNEKYYLSKAYSDSDWVYKHFSSEDVDYIFGMQKILLIMEFIFNTNILGNIDLGSNLFDVDDYSLFTDIIDRKTYIAMTDVFDYEIK